MNGESSSSECPRFLPGLLIAFAFFLPLTISIAEGLLFLILAVWVVTAFRRGGAGGVFRAGEAYRWPLLLFTVAAGLTVFWSVDAGETLRRIHRLLVPVLLFVIGGCWRDRRRNPYGALGCAAAFAAGCTARAVYDIVRIPREAAVTGEVALAGNMRDPQMYMASLCLLLPFLARKETRLWTPLLGTALALQSAAMVLHFKRGVWLSFLLAVVLMGACTRRWKTAALVLLLAGTALLHPDVRGRVAGLAKLRDDAVGGRYALWTDVAPALLPRYPQGMGWCAVDHEHLAAETPYLQAKLEHLHNNLLQVALETGWAGAAAWTAWMITALYVMGRGVTRNKDGIYRALAVGVLCGFCGLLSNGMVEYNFGDTEIMMLFSLLMGLSLAAGPESAPRGSALP